RRSVCRFEALPGSHSVASLLREDRGVSPMPGPGLSPAAALPTILRAREWSTRFEQPTRNAPVVHAYDARWDLLLVAVGGYILTAVGRVHELFPALNVVRPAILTGLVAIVLFVLDGRSDRRLRLVWTGPAKWLIAFFVWMLLAVPGALVLGTSVELVGDF